VCMCKRTYVTAISYTSEDINELKQISKKTQYRN